MTVGDRQVVVGIIGGSGVYDIDGLANKRWERVASPFGDTVTSMMRDMCFSPYGHG